MIARKRYRWKVRGGSLALGRTTVIMGILNMTPDSFSGDGLFYRRASVADAVRMARAMVAQGAAIIDVGGESTRPGATPVTVAEEIQRVVPVIRRLALLKVFISIDTCKPQVALAALEAGAHIVNVVQGTPMSHEMMAVIRRSKAGVVLMHMRGTPLTMQGLAKYNDVVRDVASELEKSVEKCCAAGIKRESIVVDPGIGFAKTATHNFRLLAHLGSFRSLNVPLLAGPSRKSFIGKTLGILEPSRRTFGTAAAVTACVLNGAHLVRVHDVAAMSEVVGIVDRIRAEAS